MCQYCKTPHPLRRSTRKHGRPPREFWLCPCGRTVQGIEHTGVDGTKYVVEIPVRERNETAVMTVRVPKWEKEEWKKSGLTARKFIESKAPR